MRLRSTAISSSRDEVSSAGLRAHERVRERERSKASGVSASRAASFASRSFSFSFSFSSVRSPVPGMHCRPARLAGTLCYRGTKLLRRQGMSLAHEPEHRTTAGRPLSIDLAVVPLDRRIALKV